MPGSERGMGAKGYPRRAHASRYGKMMPLLEATGGFPTHRDHRCAAGCLSHDYGANERPRQCSSQRASSPGRAPALGDE
jgi:hypothetical protein